MAKGTSDCSWGDAAGVVFLCLSLVGLAAGAQTCPDRTEKQQVSQGNQSPDHLFARAIELTNKSITRSRYVMITVVDDNTGNSEGRCTHAGFLLGAIARENGLEFDAQGQKLMTDIAINTKNQVFHFSKPDALSNVREVATPTDLEKARNHLHGLNREQLLSRFATTIFESSGYRCACAQILLEHGIIPSYGCRNGCGALWVEPADQVDFGVN